MGDFTDLDLQALQSGLDAESLEKTRRIAATNDWLVEWREKTLREAMQRLAADPAFAPVQQASEALLKGLAGWRDLQGKGRTTADTYWAERIAPHVAALQNGDTLQDLFRQGNLGRGGWEQEFVARLQGDESRLKEFIARFDGLGLVQIMDPPPAPLPARDDETGVIRQALNPPIDFCTGAPFSIITGGRTDSGIAINTSLTGGSRNGTGIASAETMALNVMGGGSHAITLIGTEMDIPADYTTLSVTANLTVSYSGLTVAILAGSTASTNGTMRVVLSDATTHKVDHLLTAIPSPVIAYRAEQRDNIALDLTIANIQLNGRAGPVRVFTGVEAYAAAAGIVGSSVGRMTTTFTLQRVCFTVR